MPRAQLCPNGPKAGNFSRRCKLLVQEAMATRRSDVLKAGRSGIGGMLRLRNIDELESRQRLSATCVQSCISCVHILRVAFLRVQFHHEKRSFNQRLKHLIHTNPRMMWGSQDSC